MSMRYLGFVFLLICCMGCKSCDCPPMSEQQFYDKCDAGETFNFDVYEAARCASRKSAQISVITHPKRGPDVMITP